MVGMRSAVPIDDIIVPPVLALVQPVSDNDTVVSTAGRESRDSSCASLPSHTRIFSSVNSSSATSFVEAMNSIQEAPVSRREEPLYLVPGRMDIEPSRLGIQLL